MFVPSFCHWYDKVYPVGNAATVLVRVIAVPEATTGFDESEVEPDVPEMLAVIPLLSSARNDWSSE